jgi:DNA-binding phage protein
MTNADRSESAATRSHNRIAAIMMHTDRYSFRGASRLAADTGLSKSTISHLVRGKSSPLTITVERVVKALEDQMGRPSGQQLNHQEVVSATGSYPTPSVCALVGCRGCLTRSGHSSGRLPVRSFSLQRSFVFPSAALCGSKITLFQEQPS